MAHEGLVDYVEVYSDAAGEVRWKAMSNNGREVANAGEGYKNEGYALAIVEQLFPGVKIISQLNYIKPDEDGA